MFLLQVVNYCKLTLHIKKLTLQTAALYPTNFLFQICGAFLIDCAFLMLWLIFFMRFPLLGQWGFHETALLLAIGWMSYALVAFFAGGIFTLASTVSRGGFDYFLLSPVDPLWHHVVSRTELTACGNFFASIIMLYVSGYTQYFQIFCFIVAASGAALLLFNTLVFMQSLVFYLGHVEIIAQQFLYALLDTLFYPPVVFKGTLKLIVMTILPAYFIGFIPVHLVQTGSVNSALILIASILISSFISFSFFYKGIKKYESGNSFQVRL